eukprot:CAMPEP_0198328590 /NCGR_PEP_ID=MMETSP1450-20131203/15571_1 /TAXON_ID=753684 ORGANISM="Madagascaria erythrocladiodes, Strain CCMP3234" /NCGR_SAMPLE_ID=MMETSP1450 /ASSEMBLY_ACC=CAM_ASM_001115 /LENGTH=261 /DNA_ID=CAMNT_0044032733 /DNA_START=228 /DNA_END=1013 /DNA_ORIENTATION=-
MVYSLRPKVFVIIVLFSVAVAAENGVCSRTVKVEASASASRLPDLAEVTVKVCVTRDTTQMARDAGAKNLERVMAVLTQGDTAIPEKDINVNSLRVEPVEEYRETSSRSESSHVIVGYRFSTKLTVRIAELDKVGAYVDGLLGISDAVAVTSVSFTVAAPEEVRREAIKKASEHARKDASELAFSAGASGVGRPLKLETSHEEYDGFCYSSRSASSYLVDIPEDEDTEHAFTLAGDGDASGSLKAGEYQASAHVAAEFELL